MLGWQTVKNYDCIKGCPTFSASSAIGYYPYLSVMKTINFELFQAQLPEK
jgi:hypothetical protein